MILREYIDEKNAHPNMSKDLILFREELARKFPELRYTSGYRKGATTASGNQSRHGKGEAWDIEDRQDVYDYLWNTLEGIQLLKKYNLGILDETNPDTMKRTGATGKHYHIGKDSTLVPLMEQRYNELMGNKSQVASTQTYGQSMRPTLTEEELLNMAHALRSGNTGAGQSISVSPSDMDVLNYFRIEKAKEQEAQNSQAVETKKEELMTHASTQQQEAELQDDSAYYESLMNFPDPYNYINIETYQRGGRKRPVVKDERMKAAQVKSTIPTFRERLPEVQESKYAGLIDPINLDEVVIKVSKEQLKREKYLEEAENVETSYIDRTYDAGIKTPANYEDTIKVQKFLKEKGYDLNPQGKFKNDGVDGIVGKITKAAIEDYNSGIKVENPYKSLKKTPAFAGKKGFIGECTEEQCSEYVQNELFRNIAEREYGLTEENRQEWNKKVGITGDAWDLGDNIIDAGGRELELSEIRAGDVVGIHSGTNIPEARKAGYTHSGIVDEINPDGSYYVLHNWHRRAEKGSGKKWQGREYRTLVTPDGNLPGFSGKGVVKAFRPNYEAIKGNKKPKIEPKEDIKITLNDNDVVDLIPSAVEKPVLESYTKPINDKETKSKFMNSLNVDETEYYSIAKAALGIIGQETKFGLDPAYASGAKRVGAELSKAYADTDIGLAIENLFGLDMKRNEVSKGAGSMKLKTNFDSFDLSLFDINESNISRPDKAILATMQKLTQDYKYFKKKGYNSKDAMYRAIQKYNGSLNTVSAGKTREEWAKDYDLDYPNKAINFAAAYQIKKDDGTPVKTYVDELSVEDNVIKWANRI